MKLRELYRGFVSLLTSSEFRNQISDPNGTGEVVFNNSPTFVGTVNSPTPTPGNNTTQVATTAFVQDIIIDEDDMVSNLDTKVPTQQSVKAYVDTNAGGWQLLTTVDLTNGGANDLTAVSFAIPTGTSLIKVLLIDMTANSAHRVDMQIGSSSTLQTTGYDVHNYAINGVTIGNSSATTDFRYTSDSLGGTKNAIWELTSDGATNRWNSYHRARRETLTYWGHGTVTLAGELDILEISTSTLASFNGGRAVLWYR